MKHLVLFLARVEPLLEATVVLKFLDDSCFGIRSLNCLVFDIDLIDFALLNESLVLLVANLSLLASFKFLPSFVFDHRSVSV